jgi:eukaryotic-like serine/threonine-protein kinase
LLAAPPDAQGRLSRESLARLHSAMQKEQRPAAELMPVARLIGEDTALLLDYWLSRLQGLPVPTDRPLKERLSVAETGRLILDLSGTKVTDLTALEGMPLGWLSLSNCTEVSDLSPLRDLPLRSLDLSGTAVRELTSLSGITSLVVLDLAHTLITDLSPLPRDALASLDLEGCVGVTDLSPLQGIPLTKLSLRRTRVLDLSPLEDLPLTYLDGTQIPATDFSALAGPPIQELNLQLTRVGDLAFLRQLPLKRLYLNGCEEARNFGVLSALKDLETLLLPADFRSLPEEEQASLAALRHHPKLRQIGVEIMGGMQATLAQGSATFWRDWDIEQRITGPLRQVGLREFDLTKFPDGTYSLDLRGQPISDLSVIPFNAPLAHLSVNRTKITSIDALRGMPLTRLDISETQVSDLSPLIGLPLKELFMAGTLVTDLAPLAQLPLQVLFFNNTQVREVSPLLSIRTLTEIFLPSGVTNVAVLRALPNLQRISYEWHQATGRAAETATEFWSAQDKQAPLDQALRTAGVKFNLAHTVDGGLSLNINDSTFTNLVLLKGAPIRVLNLDGSSVSDLTPLRDMPIEVLLLRENQVSSLEPIRGSRLGAALRELFLYKTFVQDLSPLRGCTNLALLDVGDTRVVDLEPLRGLPLQRLYIFGTAVADLDPLLGLPLRTLYLDRCSAITDVTPLAGLRTLTELMLPEGAAGIDRLRALPRLERVSFNWQSGVGPDQTALEFWKSRDALREKQP